MSCNYKLTETYEDIPFIEKLPQINSRVHSEVVLGYKLIATFYDYNVYEIRKKNLFYNRYDKYLIRIKRSKKWLVII